MYGCRNPGKSTNHTNRNRGLYTHKSPNFEHNDRDNIHNTADVLWKCATEKRKKSRINYNKLVKLYERTK